MKQGPDSTCYIIDPQSPRFGEVVKTLPCPQCGGQTVPYSKIHDTWLCYACNPQFKDPSPYSIAPAPNLEPNVPRGLLARIVGRLTGNDDKE